MSGDSDDRPGRHRGIGSLLFAIVAATHEAAGRQGLRLSEVAERAEVGDLLVRIGAGQAAEDELRVSHVMAISRVLGLSAGELFARAEALEREIGEP
jgi:hypothetical protein